MTRYGCEHPPNGICAFFLTLIFFESRLCGWMNHSLVHIHWMPVRIGHWNSVQYSVLCGVGDLKRRVTHASILFSYLAYRQVHSLKSIKVLGSLPRWIGNGIVLNSMSGQICIFKHDIHMHGGWVAKRKRKVVIHNQSVWSVIAWNIIIQHSIT